MLKMALKTIQSVNGFSLLYFHISYFRTLYETENYLFLSQVRLTVREAEMKVKVGTRHGIQLTWVISALQNKSSSPCQVTTL